MTDNDLVRLNGIGARARAEFTAAIARTTDELPSLQSLLEGA